MNSIKAGFWRPYSHILNGAASTPIRQNRFQEFTITTQAGDMPVKSMLHEFEAAMLYALAKDHWTGAGDILDLGPFYGISTYALASGLRANSRVPDQQKAGRIYSYDLFLHEGYEWFADTPLVKRTGSIFPDWLRLNLSQLDLVEPCPGNLLALDWTGGPIEILFIDLAKNWDLNRWVLMKTFPRLIPGHSVVIQQDWVHFAEYWIHIAMARLADRFTPIDTVYGASSAFLCTASISLAEAAEDLSALPLDEKLRLIDLSAARSPVSAREVLKLARAKCMLDHGQIDAAKEAVAGVNTHPLTDDPVLEFSGIAATNKVEMLKMIADH